MMENKGVFGLNLLQLFQENHLHPMMTDSLNQILEKFDEGQYRVIVGKTFPLAEGGQAHEALQNRKNIGKIVLVPPAP